MQRSEVATGYGLAQLNICRFYLLPYHDVIYTNVQMSSKAAANTRIPDIATLCLWSSLDERLDYVIRFAWCCLNESVLSSNGNGGPKRIPHNLV